MYRVLKYDQERIASTQSFLGESYYPPPLKTTAWKAKELTISLLQYLEIGRKNLSKVIKAGTDVNLGDELTT